MASILTRRADTIEIEPLRRIELDVAQITEFGTQYREDHLECRLHHLPSVQLGKRRLSPMQTHPPIA